MRPMNPKPPEPAQDDALRIVRFLARCGVASRRNAADIVLAGRVRVNGEVVTDLSRRIHPGRDRVLLDDRAIALCAETLTVAFNKPIQVLVSRGDPEGRQTVYDLLPERWRAEAGRLVYAGRLDFMSEGLLVMTTDGELANQMTHPSSHVEKEYLAWLERPLTPEEVARLEAGVELDGSQTMKCSVRPQPGAGPSAYSITLREGRNRQVRRMAEAVGLRVRRLIRLRIGRLLLGDLAAGEWRALGEREARLALENPPAPAPSRPPRRRP